MTQEYTEFIERKKKHDSIMIRYPGRIPIIVSTDEKNFLKKTKFIIEMSMTFAELLHVVRKHITSKLRAEEGLFLMTGDRRKLIQPNATIREWYAEYKDQDNGLYLHLAKESVFG
jgi:hypothetical protein